MKHVANRRRVVSPLPRKSYTQPKTVEKKAVNAVAVKSGKKVAAKPAPVVLARNVKPKVAVKKAVVSKQNSQPETKKVAPKTAALSPKTKSKNIKSAVVPVNNKPVKNIAAKAESKVVPQIEKPKAKNPALRGVAVKSAKTTLTTKAKTSQNLLLKSKIQTPKIEKPIAKKIVAKTVAVEKTSKPIKKVAAEKTVAVAPKAKPTLNTKPKKAVQETPKIKPAMMVKEVVKTRKNKLLTTVEKTVQPTKRSKQKVVEVTTKAKKQKEVIAPKAIKATSPKVKTERMKVVTPLKTAPTKKNKAVELPVEIIAAPLPKPKKKKVKPLGAAIFRGKKERYDFQVFPVEGEFEDAAAIFIISRRVVDRNKRAHHKMVCIGQTDSVLSELKKHRKGKCFKKYEANAISVLREENEQKRQKIESDLKSAHTIPCPHA